VFCQISQKELNPASKGSTFETLALQTLKANHFIGSLFYFYITDN